MGDPREHPELRHLLTLAAVGREHSFSRAAETLGYTQSAVSQQINRLERQLGHTLVDRPGGPRAVSLTPAGRLLLRHADAIVARLDSARADLRALADGELGMLRIGCYQSVGARLLPRVLRDFTAICPGVQVELTEAEDDEDLLHLVENGELDLTFVVYPMIGGPFAHVDLLDDPYVAVVHRESELARGDGPVRADQLAGLPILTYSRMREVHSVEHRLGRPEIADQIMLRSEDNGLLLGLAAEGVGIAVVSWLSVDPFRTDVRIVPLAEVAPRVVGLAWHRDRYRIPASEEFIRVARDEAARLMTDKQSAPTGD